MRVRVRVRVRVGVGVRLGVRERRADLQPVRSLPTVGLGRCDHPVAVFVYVHHHHVDVDVLLSGVHMRTMCMCSVVGSEGVAH